jgi:hypothetical protein
MAVEQCARSKTPALILLAAACVDESDHLALVNAGGEEVVRQEEGEREGAPQGQKEEGICYISLSLSAIVARISWFSLSLSAIVTILAGVVHRHV